MRGLFVKIAPWIRVALLGSLVTLAACSHSSGSGPPTVGVGIGVALISPSGSTIVSQGGTLQINATVTGDAANAGVRWVLSGAGSIASSTITSMIYQAPGSVVGSDFATVTAFSISDPTKYSAVTVTVNGTPTILPPVLFPANQNVPFATYVSAAGGTLPFTWTVQGALPPGLALTAGNTAVTSIAGTPTATGTWTFTVTMTDAASLTASVPLTITINAATACLLQGQFAYLVTGFRAQSPMTRAGSVTVSSTGAITGIHDYKDVSLARPATVVSSGNCVTLAQNRGQLHLSSSVAGNESFDFGTISSLMLGQVQQNDGTGIVGGGQFFRQDPTAFNQAALAGDWVFGMAGDDGAKNRLVAVGRVTLDASGNISGGVGDSNSVTPVVAGAVTGTLSAPDTNGRGTATLNVGSLSLPIAYYIVDANTLLVASSDSSTTTPRVAGRMTRQTGAGTLDPTTFAAPAILSLWGSSPVAGVPAATMAAGRLSGAAGGAATRGFVLYANGAGGGYVMEPASFSGNFGILEQQVPGPFSDFATAYYAGGTQYPGSTSPITLAPQVLFQAGSISGNVTGYYAIDQSTGRMLGTVSRTILGGSDLVMYIVSPKKLVILGDNLNITNSALSWFESY